MYEMLEWIEQSLIHYSN